jgi:hypothetical protein
MSLAQQVENTMLKGFLEFQGLAIAKVVKYNADKLTADIQFLKYTENVTSSSKDILDYPKAYNVPCATLSGNGYVIRAGYKKDDIVFVALAVSEISNAGQKTSDRSKFFSKDNAVIIGGMLTTGIPTDGKVYIGSEDSNIQLTDSEIKFTVGTTQFTIDATGATVTVGGVTVNLFTHIHGSAVGPTSPPTPGT